MQNNSLTTRKVLVLEDEYFLADDLRRAIEERGAEVIGPFSTVEAALGGLDAPRPDCAVLDVNLRGRYSFPLFDRLMEREVPFIIVSGYDREALPRDYSSAPYFTKPFDMDALLDCVDEVIGTRTPERSVRHV